MKVDQSKTKEQLIKESEEMRQRIVELEVSETKYKQIEEALRESEQNRRNSIDNSPLAILITRGGGDILYANQNMLDLFGYESVEEMRNTPIEERYPQEYMALLRERFDRMDRGEFVPEYLEQELIRTDGEARQVEVFIKRIIWNGEEVSEAIYNDITERKLAEGKIERAAAEWRITFDSIPDPISVHDKDYRLLRVNQAFADLFKATPRELIGKFCYELVHGTDGPPAYCPITQTLKTGKSAVSEEFEPNLGIWLHVVTSPVFNEKGEITRVVYVARDVTERRKSQEQLMAQDRLASIGELAAGIAHEVNNPLTGVIGFSDLLMARDLPDDIKEDLEIINKEAKRAAGIVRNLLTFARKHPQEKKPVLISQSIKAVLELRSYEQQVNNLEVNTHFDPNLPEIMANDFDLQQAFLNIIINAEHFMIEAHGRGTLTITTEHDGNVVRAIIADDGPGIASEHLARVIDPFFTTKEVGKGTGLGMSICHGIVTEHGGKINVESELGKGATFIVELPIKHQ